MYLIVTDYTFNSKPHILQNMTDSWTANSKEQDPNSFLRAVKYVRFAPPSNT
jgi:hypothetical protein